MDSQTQRPADRRRGERVVANLRVLYHRRESTFFLEGVTDNLSLDGCFVETERMPLDVGTEVGVILEPTGSEEEIVFGGIVVWASSGDSIGSRTIPRGMGIRFRDVDAESSSALLRALRTP